MARLFPGYSRSLSYTLSRSQQIDHQPSWATVCNIGCSYNHPGGRGGAPCGEAARHGIAITGIGGEQKILCCVLSMTSEQMGDATNMVLILAGELLKRAENLLIMGLHPSEVIKGYELAAVKAQAELESTSDTPQLNVL